MDSKHSTPEPWGLNPTFPQTRVATEFGFHFGQPEVLGAKIHAEKMVWPDLEADSLAWEIAKALCGIDATPSDVAMRAARISKNLKSR